MVVVAVVAVTAVEAEAVAEGLETLVLAGLVESVKGSRVCAGEPKDREVRSTVCVGVDLAILWEYVRTSVAALG